MEAVLARLGTESQPHDVPAAPAFTGLQVFVNFVSDGCAACELLLRQFYGLTKTATGRDLDGRLGGLSVSVLAQYAFGPGEPTVRRTALRCLNNILVLAPQTRQVFVDGGYPRKAMELMKSDEPDDELLSARLLLLSGIETDLDFAAYFRHEDLAGIINANISCHAKAASQPSVDPASACNASLNLLSTLAVQYGAEAYRFLDSLPPILEMFDKVSIPSPPIQPPISLLISCLASIPFHDKQHVDESRPFPAFDVDKLIDTLDLAVRAYNHDDMDRHVVPLVGLLILLAQSAPADQRARLQERLLPSDRDRELVLGKGDSLPHILLRLGAEPMAPRLKDLVPSLLFELSDRAPRKFIHNIGLGYGAGFLYSMGIPIPQDDVTPGTASSAEGGSVEVNPITGQQQHLERQPRLTDMTREEKEREAERLFVLFERLSANGVMSIENPISQAVRTGQFEEMPSSGESGSDDELGG